MNLKLISLVFLSGTLLVRGQGTFVWDQQATGLPDGQAFLNFNQPLGQSFTPTFSSIGVAAFNLAGGPSNSGDIEVNLRSGSITGPILGTSEVLTVNSIGVYDFLFSTPVTLSPGTTYYLQPFAVNDGVEIGAPLINAPVPTGGAIYDGVSHNGFNFWFQEGIVSQVPEPSATTLVAVATGLTYWRKRKMTRHQKRKTCLLRG